MTRAERIWQFIQSRGTATVADLRHEFGLSAKDATSTVRHLYRQGCLTRKQETYNHCKRFAYLATNHNPPGQGCASLAMRPIAVAPEKLPLVTL